MSLHKIRGVDKAVCSAEQKIAYNIAWRIGGDCRYNWSAFSAEDERGAVEDYRRAWLRDYPSAARKYDTDAIFAALASGLHDYLTSGGRIMTSYAEVGRAFPIATV